MDQTLYFVLSKMKYLGAQWLVHDFKSRDVAEKYLAFRRAEDPTIILRIVTVEPEEDLGEF